MNEIIVQILHTFTLTFNIIFISILTISNIQVSIAFPSKVLALSFMNIIEFKYSNIELKDNKLKFEFLNEYGIK
jgi:hypothetical protein